jgi:hypothetical protein
MTPASVERMIEKHGETCILRRLTGTELTSTDVTIKAKFKSDGLVEMEGSAEQQSGEARFGNLEILAAGWPAPVKQGDQLVRFPSSANPQPLEIVHVDPKMLGDDVAMWVVRWEG